MNLKLLTPFLAMAGTLGFVLFSRFPSQAGETAPALEGYRVLAPLRHGNLTVFPVVTAARHDTASFLTLDEGLRSGEVVVTEAGAMQPMVRRQGVRPPQGGAQVNQLLLMNNSKRPLILLAGEIVTGGKQDRVIGKDRLVPADSDPIDLNVFCVEPGRWTARTAKFDSMGAAMAQPAVRSKAMSAKDQAQVWSEVRKAQDTMAGSMSAPAAAPLRETTSYANVMANADVQAKIASVAGPMEKGYQSLVQQLRDRNAVGVVVAVNGEIVWADIFASTNLLEKYWPKLVRPYAAEAVLTQTKNAVPSEKAAQEFLDHLEGRREVAESEPGLYRQTEITGDGFKAFELTSLLPKTGFDLHIAKMAE